MMAAMGGVIFGYDIGISGGVTSMEPFLKKFFRQVYTKMKQDTEVSNYCKFDSQLLTSFTSSLYVAGLVASFFASWLTKSRGRKPSILLGGAAFLAGAALGGAASNIYMLIFGRVLLGVGVGFANQVLVGAIMAAELGDHGGIGKGYAVAVIVLIGFYVAGFGVSWGPLGWLVPSEIFSLEIRSAGQSIVVAVSFLFTFVVAQTFLSMLCHLKAGIFFFFGGWVVVMTVFVYLLLPETKGLPIEKMGDVWREHWFWNRVVVVGGPGVGEHLPAKFGEGGSQSSVVDL
ncbi:unnamed protein product [Linum tenue]|uniref:Major facilitator superfamily (MFS) profile domain-containing protein n=1 Tax=Linum tenue TaxID=586396 RepID=A0AAV0H7N9_9ROSI|nr:unnamed protein product [Linum tenue]